MFKNEALIIYFEGSDYSGKTTMCKYTKEFLSEMFSEKEVKIFREPGGTKFGEKIREILLSSPELDDLTQITLYSACRNELYEKELKPIIENNGIIILDRSILSTFVYEKDTESTIKISRQILNKPFLLSTPKVMCLLNVNDDDLKERMNNDRDQETTYYDLMNQKEIAARYKKAMVAINKMDNFNLFNTGAILNLNNDLDNNKAIVKKYILEQIDRIDKGEL